MRLAASSIPFVLLALAGCASFGPPPDVSALPHATVVDSHVEVDSDRTDTFRVTEIDGHDVLPRTDQPAKLIGHDARHLVGAGHPVRVTVEAFGFYANTARRLFWDSMRATGVVEFVPVADAKYAVHGSVTPALSTAWIENEATHEIVGNRISVAGRAAPAAAAASAGE